MRGRKKEVPTKRQTVPPLLWVDEGDKNTWVVVREEAEPVSPPPGIQRQRDAHG